MAGEAQKIDPRPRRKEIDRKRVKSVTRINQEGIVQGAERSATKPPQMTTLDLHRKETGENVIERQRETVESVIEHLKMVVHRAGIAQKSEETQKIDRDHHQNESDRVMIEARGMLDRARRRKEVGQATRDTRTPRVTMQYKASLANALERTMKVRLLQGLIKVQKSVERSIHRLKLRRITQLTVVPTPTPVCAQVTTPLLLCQTPAARVPKSAEK